MGKGFRVVSVFLALGIHQQVLHAADPSFGTRLGSGEYPAISGELVVWYDNKGIYVYDLAKQTAQKVASLVLADAPSCVGGSSHPDIHGNVIVWDDHLNSRCNSAPDYNVYACTYDRATGACPVHQLTTNSADQLTPKVSSTGLIVWVDRRNQPLSTFGNDDIYGCLYDLVSGACPERQLTSDLMEQFAPSVSDFQVAWQDVRNVYADVFTCTFDPLSGACPNVQVTQSNTQWGYPEISGHRIVNWVLGAGPLSPPDGLYAFDVTQPLAAPQTVALGAGKVDPSIDGDRVVWRDTGARAIFQHDFATQQTIQLTTQPEEENEVDPDISGERVVFVAADGGVYMIGSFPPPPEPSLGPNLVANGGFEQGRTEWSSFGTTRFLTTESAVEGAISVKFLLGKKGQVIQHNKFPVMEGRLYQPAVSIKTVSVAAFKVLQAPAMGKVSWLRADGTLIGESVDVVGAVPSTADWASYSTGVLTAPAGAAFAKMSLGTPVGSGTVYFDDVRLQEVLP